MGAVNREVARMIAPAFLLFIRAVVLFVDDNHAEILNGVNSEERVPITIAASPFLLSATLKDVRCRLNRSAGLPTGALKRSRKRAIVCGVRPISGTITSACFALSEHVFQNAEIDLCFA